MKNKRFGLFILAAMVVTGCGDCCKGKIVGIGPHSEGYVQSVLMSLPDGNGGIMLVPQMNYIPASWTVYVDNGKDTNLCECTESQWEAYRVRK